MQTGDATSRPHYSCWRRLARDRRTSGTRVAFDVFLSSQIAAGTTVILLPITEMASQTLVELGICALAARDTVAMRLRHWRLHSTQAPPARARPNPARLTTCSWPKHWLQMLVVVSLRPCVSDCGVSEPQVPAISHGR